MSQATARAVDVGPVLSWRPNPGPQESFLLSMEYEALYGGAAGGGKSDALLFAALYGVPYPTYSGLLLRRTFPELIRSLIPRSRLWYPMAGGRYNETEHMWRFPSGATIEFGHLEHEHSVEKYLSAEFQFIGFDELTTFLESQYRKMRARARSTSDSLPVLMRGATNPGGPGHDWVMRTWEPWLNTAPDYKGIRAKPAEVLRYNNIGDGEEYTPSGRLTRVFFPAKVADNPKLSGSDPEYVHRLGGLDPVSQRQMRDGDWLARPAPGAYFQRAWFDFVDVAPPYVKRVRRWDLAATTPQENPDADWTEGLRVSITKDRTFYIDDLVSLRDGPGEVEKAILNTAQMDGRQTEVIVPQDPGQAGKAQLAAFVKLLAGFPVRGELETGDKVTRCKPASAQAFGRRISIVRAPWNERLIQQLEAFPSPGVHDDIVDTLSGAVNALTGRLAATYTDAEESGRRRI